jgi:hypothetical protein
MNEAEDLADLAWSTPDELQRSIIEMLRRRYGDIELSSDCPPGGDTRAFRAGSITQATTARSLGFPWVDLTDFKIVRRFGMGSSITPNVRPGRDFP